MKAAVLYEFNKPLVIEELEIPKLESGQVLVKLTASALCHTQLEEMTGTRGDDPYMPHLLGHEGAGIVEEIGPDVTHVKPGDHVVLGWMKGPGINSETPKYHKGETKINAGWITTFNEYGIISENRVTKIKEEMPLDLASLLGCAVTTGLGIVFHQAKIKAKSSVAVFGVGGVGLNILQGAVLSDASKIIAVDLNDEKLELAKKIGATHTINAGKVDAVKKVKELTDGKGVDYGFEAAGNIKVMEQTYNATQEKGLTILAGVPNQGDKMTIDPMPLYTGKRLTGSHGGNTVKEEDIPRYVDFYLDGKLKLDELITHRLPLEKINEGFELMKEGKTGKILIEFKN